MTERASSAAYAAHVRWSLDEHEPSELPQARMETPGTGPSSRTLHDLLLGLLLGQAQGAQLQYLLPRYLPLMAAVYQRRVPVVRRKLRRRVYPAVLRDDGVAPRVPPRTPRSP